jgi:acetyltransferase-like isoleucine patch superfamily enzyme
LDRVAYLEIRFRTILNEISMIRRIIRVWKRPLSRNLQYFSFRWTIIVGNLFYRARLRGLGSNTIVRSPLFWTPEFITLGKDVLVWNGCRIECIEIENQTPHIVFGDGVTLQQNCHITAAGVLDIGAGTTILCGAMITDMDHCYDVVGVRVADQRIEVTETRIGKNCFIGAGAKIFPGTVLGDNCVVGANAVVRGKYPPGSVIVGIPGRVVKQYNAVTATWARV